MQNLEGTPSTWIGSHHTRRMKISQSRLLRSSSMIPSGCRKAEPNHLGLELQMDWITSQEENEDKSVTTAAFFLDDSIRMQKSRAQSLGTGATNARLCSSGRSRVSCESATLLSTQPWPSMMSSSRCTSSSSPSWRRAISSRQPTWPRSSPPAASSAPSSPPP
jgi:hypothetical protein